MPSAEPVQFIIVPRHAGESVRRIISNHGLLDKSVRIISRNDTIWIPLLLPSGDKGGTNTPQYAQYQSYQQDQQYRKYRKYRQHVQHIITRNTPLTENDIFFDSSISPSRQTEMVSPFARVVGSPRIPNTLKAAVPDKWELYGDVLILKFTNTAHILSIDDKIVISEIFADVLGAASVIEEIGPIEGITRKPSMRQLIGDRTIAHHKENGIIYSFDTTQLMFSSGNVDERIRMSSLNAEGETIVDLFAGIGYFTLPLAVHAGCEKIFACEINPISYDFLSNNLELNEVSHLVDPLLGDCRNIAPENVADRVIMGYLMDTITFLPVGIRALKPRGGIIHYHTNWRNDDLPDGPFTAVEETVRAHGRNARLIKFTNVKSYSPGISHIVLDVEIK